MKTISLILLVLNFLFAASPAVAETYFCRTSVRHFCENNSNCELKNDLNPSEYRVEEGKFKSSVTISKYVGDKKTSSWSAKQVVSNSGVSLYVEESSPNTVLTLDKVKMKFSLSFTSSNSKDIWYQLELGGCK